MKHPLQPIVTDKHGVQRFKENKIVSDLLDAAAKADLDLNVIARRDYRDEDRRQLAQLIGYSVSGYGSLAYVGADESSVADMIAQDGLSETDARINYLESELAALRNSLREPMARLFGMHPDDFLAGVKQ